MDFLGNDHTLLRNLQIEYGNRLELELAKLDKAGKLPMTPENDEAFRTNLIHEVVNDYARAQAERGEPMTWEQIQDYIEDLKNRLQGAGSLSSLLRDDSIEEIDINGYQNVFVDYENGVRARERPVFGSNEELIEAIQTLAAHEGLSGRAFDTANPQVNFRLGTSRVQAVMGVTPFPSVSIRLHPKSRLFTLKDLVANGTIDQQLADFLAAGVRARKNFIIGGETSAGKTALLRAMAAEIPPEERLLTIERALELGLEDDPEAHPDVVPMEERLPNAEGEGGVSMRELLLVSKRMRPDRVIVGEVLGDEILVMLNAMMQGNDGSLSTIHANSSEGIVEIIYSYAAQAPEQLTKPATISMIANGLDFLVFAKRVRTEDGQRRMVTSVREVTGADGEMLVTNEIFTPGPDGAALRQAHPAIACIDDLRAVGYRDVGEPERWA